MERFNLIQVYEKAFGTQLIRMALTNSPVTVFPTAGFGPIKTITDAAESGAMFAQRYNMFGNPFFMPCKIDDFQLPNEPLIEISGSKTIIKTPIDGNEGTFKEHFTKGDYVITIRGICVNEDDTDDYPEEQVRGIRDIIEKQEHVSVTNRLLSFFNIDHLAIESFRFPAVEGAPGMQPYELSCLSDRFMSLELLEGTI